MKTHLKPWKIVFTMAMFFLVLVSISIYSQLELPAPSGPYAVGRTIYRWMDLSRLEEMTAESGDFREVMAFIWYPAEAGTGIKAGYIPDLSTISSALLQSGELTWWEVRGLRLVRSESRLNASPLQREAPFPVVLLLPGNATNIEFYSSLASEIASHGYIVVGINHPYDVPAVHLSVGSVAPYDKAQWSLDVAAHQAYIRERHPVKVADVLFVLAQLEGLSSNADSPFAGILDLTSVAVAGHSLGGIVASEACKADTRLKACINFDGLQQGGPFSMEASAIPPDQPFLFLTKEVQLHPKLLESFESTYESYWIVIHNASHDSFTDGPMLQPSLVPVSNQEETVMNQIQQYTLAFLDQVLKDRANSLLSNSVDAEEVSVRVFPSRK